MDPGYSWQPRNGRVCKSHQPLRQAAPADRGAAGTFLPHTRLAQAEGKAGSTTKCQSPSRGRGKRPAEPQGVPAAASQRCIPPGPACSYWWQGLGQHPRQTSGCSTHPLQSHSEQIPTGLSSLSSLDHRGNIWWDSVLSQQRCSSLLNWKHWDQLCSSAELAQDKYLFPYSPTSNSSSLCQPAVWQE